MSAGYDPFYWLDRELDMEYEEEQCLQQKKEENISEEVTSQE